MTENDYEQLQALGQQQRDAGETPQVKIEIGDIVISNPKTAYRSGYIGKVINQRDGKFIVASEPIFGEYREVERDAEDLWALNLNRMPSTPDVDIIMERDWLQQHNSVVWDKLGAVGQVLLQALGDENEYVPDWLEKDFAEHVQTVVNQRNEARARLCALSTPTPEPDALAAAMQRIAELEAALAPLVEYFNLYNAYRAEYRGYSFIDWMQSYVGINRMRGEFEAQHKAAAEALKGGKP